jgi:long-chain acyl-CoA synthetase
VFDLGEYLGNTNTFLRTEKENISYDTAIKMGSTYFDNKKKELVLLLCEKNLDTIIAYLACLFSNKVPILIDNSSPINIIAQYAYKYKPNYIIGNTPFSIDGYQKCFAESKKKIGLIRSTEIGIDIYEDLSLLLTTSGSTGSPKLVRYSQHNIIAATDAICRYLAISSEARSVTLLPFQYSFGLSVLHNVIFSKSELFITDKSVLDRTLWADLEKFSITDYSLVPNQIELVQRMRFAYPTLRKSSRIMQAGGKLADTKISKMLEILEGSDVKYFTMYGQTEASPRISYVPPLNAKSKIGSVGVPIPGGKVSLNKADPTLDEGELIYHGPNVSLGYADKIADLAVGDINKGILHTGDLAQIDPDGFIYITGRRSRFIKISGISVSLDHLEESLNEDAIRCAVAGLDEKLGVFFVSKYLKTSDVQAKIKDILNIHQSAISIHQMVELPLNSNGKIDYSSLTKSLKIGKS